MDLTQLYNLLNDPQATVSDAVKNELFKQGFKEFHKRIKHVFDTWFPNSKKISGEDMVNMGFKIYPKKDMKIKVKYSLACLLESSERVFQNSQRFWKQKNEIYYENERVFLREIAFEASIFLFKAAKELGKEGFKLTGFKGKGLSSTDAYYASQYFLRKFNSQSGAINRVLEPVSIFLIRQSIELWVKEVLHISYVEDDKGNLVVVKPEMLLSLLDEIKIQLPIKKRVIMNIHEWTQPFVHAGWSRNLWEVEHAQEIIRPLFNFKAIKIQKKHYNSIENIVKHNLKGKTNYSKKELVIKRNELAEITIEE